MKHQLKQEEIGQLFSFVQSKNVPYRDVQFEIVDHLASAIEDYKEEQPEWSFDRCLKEIYNKFPITGFAIVQLEKEKALKKYWRKKMIPYIQEYFKLPKIILTIFAFFMIQQMVSLFGYKDLSILKPIIDNNFGISLVWPVWFGVLMLRRKHWKKSNPTTDGYLFIKGFQAASNFLFNLLWFIPFTFLYVKLLIGGYLVDFGGLNSYIFAGCILSLFLTLYLKKYVFDALLHLEAEQRYGHLELNGSAINKAKYYYEHGLDVAE